MRFSLALLLLSATQLVLGTPLLEKRASSNDVATVGYATLNGGTSGGSGGTVTKVSTLAAFTTAVSGDTKAIVILTASLSGSVVVKIGSNKTVLGASSSITLTGIGLRVLEESNVIIRNLKIVKVLAGTGDAIGIQESHNVWVDHVNLSSDLSHDKDYYDGLLDITHGSNYITVSYSYLHDHWKASLVGHSDSNGSEDAAITVTYTHNHWYNLNSRTPSFRFGKGHIFNNYFHTVNDGINTRQGAQLLIQNNVFEGVSKPIYSTDSGYAVATGNDLGGGSNTAPTGTLTTVPYSFTLGSTSGVKANVVANAGALLAFG